jgi:hypothetical protein
MPLSYDSFGNEHNNNNNNNKLKIYQTCWYCHTPMIGLTKAHPRRCCYACEIKHFHSDVTKTKTAAAAVIVNLNSIRSP